MNIYAKTVFKVLDFELPLWTVIVIFAIIGIISLTLYILILFRKNRKYFFNKEEVNAIEFKRLEKFEELRNDFELEIGQVKKILKEQKVNKK